MYWWFSLVPPISSTDKSSRHEETEIFLLPLTLLFQFKYIYSVQLRNKDYLSLLYFIIQLQKAYMYTE